MNIVLHQVLRVQAVRRLRGSGLCGRLLGRLLRLGFRDTAPGGRLILPAFLGQEGIFYAEVVAWAGAAILLVATYFVRMKKLERELPSAEK